MAHRASPGRGRRKAGERAMSTILDTPTQPTTHQDPGPEYRVLHRIPPADILESVVNGTAVTALCGHTARVTSTEEGARGVGRPVVDVPCVPCEAVIARP
ncbi:DUF3039 domain-containing protein [Pseudactinotalea sp. Z1739]|uniref:DUF3039 domain-containing protein n=1 Tax=Pseudactinotalea sp. Z1739 TaxID=3413028 RepID=UPI003C7DDB72